MREFTDLRAFSRHLKRAAARVPGAIAAAAEKGAAIIEKEARGELGAYQAELYPFDAWPALADSTKKDRERQGYTPDDPGLRSGEMRDSIGHLTDRNEAVIGSRSDKLVWFEQGTRTQPPRSVLGLAAVRSKEKVIAAAVAQMDKIFR